MPDQQPVRLDVDPDALEAASVRLFEALRALQPHEVYRAPPDPDDVGHDKLWLELDRFFEDCGAAIDTLGTDQSALGRHLRECAQAYQATEHTIAAEMSTATSTQPDQLPRAEGGRR